MRLAWFKPDEAPTDDSALLVAALRERHEINVINATAAHEFVWRHARKPYDLCIYELDNTAAHQFVYPYLVHYPGVLWLRRTTLQTSRGNALARDGRLDDFGREFAFAHPGAAPPLRRDVGRIVPGRWPMLSVPLASSRITVVAHAATAESLAIDYPGTRVRAVLPPVGPLARATDASREDVVVALEWPVDGAPLVNALAGFSAGRPVIVFDCLETADWPSIDPQNWQPRTPGEPICITIDPRDADHSLRLAMRRVKRDPGLGARLGRAALAWSRAHATVEHATARMEEVLEEATRMEPPPRPAGWPAHLLENGTTRAREVLAAFGLKLPF
jgi:hypothetical protein